ncbi:MAG: peptide chain release factor N(5)-glutamine methyltransferase [Gallionella sp.]|nr:peptide chain release factor N(5)-glutamine methyltransferase [Gallionella sp.]
MPSIADILREAARSISNTLALDLTTSRIEVQCLLQHVLDVQRAYLLAHPEQLLNEAQRSTFDVLLQRRMRGEPIAHLLGEREFLGLNFKVTPATLIPRPETELLVELALQRLPQGVASHVLDLGTGSGAIALSIADSRRDAEVVAVDASKEALAVAIDNAQKLHAENTRFIHSDWFSALGDERFDLIVSNPPYIATDDVHLTQGDVRFEPLSALVSGMDGLDDIRRIIQEAPSFLASNGWLLLEHGYDQAEAVRALLKRSGFVGVFSEKDLAGIERVSGGEIG